MPHQQIIRHPPDRNGVVGTAESLQLIQQPAFRGLEQRVLQTPLLGTAFPGGRIAELRTNTLSDLWIVGDLHGDLPAMINIWRYASSESFRAGLQPGLLFLGDFIDRGMYSSECLQFLFWLIVHNPGAIGIIPGNHDVSLTYDPEHGFRSRVTPAEYAASLKSSAAGSLWNRYSQNCSIAHTAIELFRRCPAAVITSDGTLFSHGGVPHVDLHPRIRSFEDLSMAPCVEDFTWLRLNTTAPKKRPNRHNPGCEFGGDDFDQFCRLSVNLQNPVRQLVRGHDHHPQRYQIHSTTAGAGILTLNSMGHWLPDEQANSPAPLPCIGRYVYGRLPEVHQVPMPQPADLSFAQDQPAMTEQTRSDLRPFSIDRGLSHA